MPKIDTLIDAADPAGDRGRRQAAARSPVDIADVPMPSRRSCQTPRRRRRHEKTCSAPCCPALLLTRLCRRAAHHAAGHEIAQRGAGPGHGAPRRKCPTNGGRRSTIRRSTGWRRWWSRDNPTLPARWRASAPPRRELAVDRAEDLPQVTLDGRNSAMLFSKDYIIPPPYGGTWRWYRPADQPISPGTWISGASRRP